MKRILAVTMIAALALAPMRSFAEEKTYGDFARDNQNAIAAILITATGVTIVMIGKLMSVYFAGSK